MRRSHSRFELSLEQLNSIVPGLLISTDVTSPRWEDMVLMHSPDTISQNLMVLSLDLTGEGTEAIRLNTLNGIKQNN
jgi:hypothetical protein